MKDYCYIVTIDVPSMMRSIKGTSKYSRELQAMFTAVENGCYSYAVRYAMTKEQLALFLYLRCRAGGSNGMRDLDMTRAAHDVRSGYEVDLRSAATPVDEAAPHQLTLVELAKQLTKVNELLDKLDSGAAMNYDGLPLNSEHMAKVLQAQRSHLRAKVIAATAVGD